MGSGNGNDKDQTCHQQQQKEPDSDNSMYLKSSDGEHKERACDSLIMCIVTTLNQGLRNGGGIGDILRAPSSKVCEIYHHFFFLVNENT